jgi:KTSC domain
MKREFVRSRSIRSIRYARAKKVLEIEFRNGPRVYEYYGVPTKVYHELMTAESKGAFVNRVIKTFPYREITEERRRLGGVDVQPHRLRPGRRPKR